MNKESKTDVLLRMMEQPGQYTEQQWRDILSDDECCELYTMMALTQSSIDATQADAALTEKEIEEEWEKTRSLSREGDSLANDEKLCAATPLHHGRGRGWVFSYRKIAAIFLAVVFFCSLSIAAYRVFSPRTDSPQSAQVTAPSLTGRAGGESFVRFSDIRLDSILTVVSAHYGKAVCFRNEEPRAMKLITTWNPEDSLSAFIDHLNMFDYLHLTLRDDTIFVESTNDEEGAQ